MLPPWAIVLITIGVVAFAIGAYFAFLYFIGDIGSRPKVYTEVSNEEFSTIRTLLWPVHGTYHKIPRLV